MRAGHNIQVIHGSDAKAVKRVLRKPQHPFCVNSRPFEITPFLFAPVLPGDTLTNFLMQSRVVTDPILNKLIGWWKEYYYFYVPLRACCSESVAGNVFGEANVVSMMTVATENLQTTLSANLLGANQNASFGYKGALPWLGNALRAVVQEFFRDEGDDFTTALSSYQGVYIDRRNGFQSLLADNATGDDVELPGVDDLEEQDKLANFPTEYDKWEILRDSGLIDVTYEDYLRAQGVDIPASEDMTSSGRPIIKPELLRFIRKWTYPTNHVEPTTGVPTSACSWSIVERGDKRYQFLEPGFIMGVTVTRPKVYLGSQIGSLTGLMGTFKAWPSVVLKDHPETKLIKVTHSATDGPLQNQATQDYWVDIGDLFNYGEQFVNFAQTVADNHALSFPSDLAGGATLSDRVPTLAQSKSFFVDAAGTKNLVREDGICHLTIASRVGRDTTPGGQ